MRQFLIANTQKFEDAYDVLIGVTGLNAVELSMKYERAKHTKLVFQANEIMRELRKQFTFKLDVTESRRKVYLYRDDLGYYIDAANVMGEMIQYLLNIGENHSNDKCKRNVNIKGNLDTIAEHVISHLSHDTTSIDMIRRVDQTKYFVCLSGVYERDHLTKSYFEKNGPPKPIKNHQFDVIDPIRVVIQSDTEYNSAKSVMNLALFKRVMTNWYKDSDLNLGYFSLRSLLEQDNRGVAIFLTGDGENGKSSFIELMRRLVGKYRSVQIDLNSFNKSSSLYKITSDTHLIYSTEAADGYINKDAWNEFKKLVDGEEVDTFVKYKNNVEISTSAVQIFASNSQTKIPENNWASVRRIIMIKFNDVKDQDRDKTINLNDLFNDFTFLTTVTNFVFRNTENLSKYPLTEEKINESRQIINEADSTYHFVEEMRSDFEGIRRIPYRALFTMYEAWCRNAGRQDYVKTQQAFIKAVTRHMSAIRYVKSNDRAYFSEASNSSDDMLRYLHSISKINDSHYNSNYFELLDNYITQEDIHDVEEKIESQQFDVSSCTDKDRICVAYLAAIGNSVALQLIS